MIKIDNLKVGVNDEEILKGVTFNVNLGKNYCLLGKNGSGKSTLASFLMGHPKYKYISGIAEIDGKNLNDLSASDRSKQGIFLSFQNVPEISGITLREYLRTIYNISLKNKNPEIKEISPFIFKRFILKYLKELNIGEDFLRRDLNVGFSGGEKRKIEILQMKLIGPKYIILDEIDSGLDLDAFKTVASLLSNISTNENSLIIITHNFKILDYVNVDEVFIIKDGTIVKKGDKKLIDEVCERGFENI